MSSPTLTAAELKPRSTDIVATWSIDGDLPDRGTWLLSTTLVGGEDGPIHQFGVKVIDGGLCAAFIFDRVAVRQHNPVISPQRVGQRWTAVFPTSGITPAGSGRWTATLNIDGQDVNNVEGELNQP